MSDPRKFLESLARARAGEGEALGQLLVGFRGYLLKIAREELDADLQAKGGASDLVQETFVDARRDFARFVGGDEAELRAWLRRILLNNLANFTRGYRETEKRRVEREVPLDDGSGDRGLAADQSTPSGQAMKDERAEALVRALEQLPEDYRRVLQLRHEEELSFKEIAEVMGRSPQAVHKLWARAVERLQQDLENPP
jgi:RNA polymerase sigma-70 factor (ECF subfamily)